MDQIDIVKPIVKELDETGSEIMKLRHEIHELKKVLDQQNDILGELTGAIIKWKDFYRSVYELPKMSAEEIFADILNEDRFEEKDGT